MPAAAIRAAVSASGSASRTAAINFALCSDTGSTSASVSSRTSAAKRVFATHQATSRISARNRPEASRTSGLIGVGDPHTVPARGDHVEDMGPLGAARAVAEADLLPEIGDRRIGVQDEEMAEFEMGLGLHSHAGAIAEDGEGDAMPFRCIGNVSVGAARRGQKAGSLMVGHDLVLSGGCLRGPRGPVAGMALKGGSASCAAEVGEFSRSLKRISVALRDRQKRHVEGPVPTASSASGDAGTKLPAPSLAT